jgi:hypothetical protein
VREEKAVHGVTPDYRGVTRLANELKIRGFLITARSDGTHHRNQPVHCVTRCIFPDGEDPVTGITRDIYAHHLSFVIYSLVDHCIAFMCLHVYVYK